MLIENGLHFVELFATADAGAFAKSYHGTFNLDAAGAFGLIVLTALTFMVPRTLLLLPLILGMCFMPVGQRLVLATVDLPVLRILVMAGLLRTMFYGENAGFRLCLVDLVVIGWAALMLTLGTFHTGGLLRLLGGAFDTLGAYFLARVHFRGADDLGRVGRMLIFVVPSVALLLVYEKVTGRNPFSFFNSVAELADMRFGKVRARGAFIHPIICGCFLATALPLIATQLWQRGWRTGAAIGVVASVVGVFCTSSSGPMLAVAAGIGAAALLPWRRWVRSLRWLGLFTLCALHFVMEAPVWHLISRISISRGSTGWHRYHLIDQWIKHAHEWLLIGSAKGTGHWGAQLFDVTNHYVGVSLSGGLVGLLLFIGLMGMGWAGIGRSLRRIDGDARSAPDPYERQMLNYQRVVTWAAGVLLFQHAVAFVGVSYLGQLSTFWWITFAGVVSLGVHQVAELSPVRNDSRQPTVVVSQEVVA